MRSRSKQEPLCFVQLYKIKRDERIDAIKRNDWIEHCSQLREIIIELEQAETMVTAGRRERIFKLVTFRCRDGSEKKFLQEETGDFHLIQSGAVFSFKNMIGVTKCWKHSLAETLINFHFPLFTHTSVCIWRTMVDYKYTVQYMVLWVNKHACNQCQNQTINRKAASQGELEGKLLS